MNTTRSLIAAALLASFALPAAAEPLRQTVTVERQVAGPKSAAIELLRSPSRWTETFREATEVESQNLAGGRRRVTVRSPSANHPHTLTFTDDDKGTRFTFTDDDHDVSLQGRFIVKTTGVGTRVTLVVTVVRSGLLTLVPDMLVENRLGAFLDDILADLDQQLRREGMLLASR